MAFAKENISSSDMSVENLANTVTESGTIDHFVDATGAGFPGQILAQGVAAHGHLSSLVGHKIRFGNWTYGGTGPDYTYLHGKTAKVIGLAGVYPVNYMILDIPYLGATWAHPGGGVDFNYSYVERLEKENISSVSLNVESGQEKYLYTLNKTGTKWNLNTNNWNKDFGNFPIKEANSAESFTIEN